MKRSGLVVLFALVSAVVPAFGTGSARPQPRKSCRSAEYRQFDFFVGDWDAYDAGKPSGIRARNRVDLILGGCVVREDYDGRNGLHGQSFSLYDAARRRWHQSWVTNRGELLLLDGGMRDGRMVLTGTHRAADGTSALIRGIWYRQGADVRETATRSTDGGKTWKPLFDIVFRAHRR